MGSPPKMKKHYDTPRRPWDKEKLEEDKGIMKKYGLRRKQEIYRAETFVRQIRRRARALFAEHSPEKEAILFKKIRDLGLGDEGVTLNKILELNAENLLERRLQTIVWKKKLANTITQARQFITHGHIMVGGKKVTSPSYLVRTDEGEQVLFLAESTLNSKFKYMERKAKGSKKSAEPEEKEEEKILPDAVKSPLPEKIEEELSKIK